MASASILALPIFAAGLDDTPCVAARDAATWRPDDATGALAAAVPCVAGLDDAGFLAAAAAPLAWVLHSGRAGIARE